MERARGSTHIVRLEGRLAIATLWHRPELSVAERAEGERNCIAALDRLTLESPHIRGVVLDLRTAFEVLSPQADEALFRFLRGTIVRSFRVALVAGAKQAQRVQLGRLLAEAATPRAMLLDDLDTASDFALTGLAEVTSSGVIEPEQAAQLRESWAPAAAE